jgi:hypothetical protein
MKFEARSHNCEKRLLASSCLYVCPSVRPRGTTRLPLDGFLLNLISQYFSKIWSRKFEFHLNLTRMTGTSYEDLTTFMIASLWILLRMPNIWDKICRKNQHTHFISKKNCSYENRAIYGTCKNTVHPNRPHMTIWCMVFSCRVTTATDTHTQNL